jgi:hypothetical protein
MRRLGGARAEVVEEGVHAEAEVLVVGIDPRAIILAGSLAHEMGVRGLV